MKWHITVAILIVATSSFSCGHRTSLKDSFTPSFSTYASDSVNSAMKKAKNEIFYGIMTPVEVCNIFNRLGVPHNDSILNPVSNKDLYLSNSKASINTGIYGVDFGYLKVFGIGQQLIDYMITIREMSDKLGIPEYYLTEPLRKVENDIAEPDTILNLMNKAYTRIEDHLRENGRESTAGLMVMGGWVESMYIATQLVYKPEKPDPEVIQRIAEQKYTLNTLLSFLKNYYDDPVVVYYSKKLKFLKNYFDSFEIYFHKGDLEIDKSRQVIRSTGSDMNITVSTLNMIRDYIAKLRTEMTSPV